MLRRLRANDRDDDPAEVAPTDPTAGDAAGDMPSAADRQRADAAEETLEIHARLTALEGSVRALQGIVEDLRAQAAPPGGAALEKRVAALERRAPAGTAKRPRSKRGGAEAAPERKAKRTVKQKAEAGGDAAG